MTIKLTKAQTKALNNLACNGPQECGTAALRTATATVLAKHGLAEVHNFRPGYADQYFDCFTRSWRYDKHIPSETTYRVTLAGREWLAAHGHVDQIAYLEEEAAHAENMASTWAAPNKFRDANAGEALAWKMKAAEIRNTTASLTAK